MFERKKPAPEPEVPWSQLWSHPEESSSDSPRSEGRLMAGRMVCGFRLEEHLARGGTSDLYRGRGLRNEVVALKVGRPQQPPVRDEMVRRFAAEARILADLDHDGVVGFLGFGRNADRPVLCLELIDGQTLENLVASGKFSENRALSIALELCRVLIAVHGAGFVHLDLKPSNVMIEASGRVRLIDFGLAGPIRREERVGFPRPVLGTPQYMAPEQAGGDAIDDRTDLYAFGLLFLEMLSGLSPLAGGSASGGVPRPEALERARSRACKQTLRILECCLQKDPGQRFKSASHLCRALLLATLKNRVEPIPRTLGNWPSWSVRSTSRSLRPAPGGQEADGRARDRQAIGRQTIGTMARIAIGVVALASGFLGSF